MTKTSVSFKREEKRTRTVGLSRSGQREIQIEVNSPELQRDAEAFLEFVVRYTQDSGRRILPGETFPYGYWLVKFQEWDEWLELWEYNAAATEFVRGASLTLTYWREQHQVCDRFGGSFTPPRPDRLTVIDEGVYEGLPVQAVRYWSPEHMSGWWITTDRYDGNVSTLRREHTYHITAARPDLAAYIALPYGFRFELGRSQSDAWLDDAVAADTSAT